MKSLQEIVEVEARYTGSDGEATLGKAYEMLLQRWRSGARDLETGLRLLFLAWYSVTEPPSLTGLSFDFSPYDTVDEVFRFFGGESISEPELLACIGFMATIAPYGLGQDEEAWERIGKDFTRRGPRIGEILKPLSDKIKDFEKYNKLTEYLLKKI